MSDPATTLFQKVFGIYALSAQILFGQELSEFANYGRSLNTCWILLLGEFDMDHMNDVGRFESGIWFWSFTWLVMLVMLNLACADPCSRV